MDKNDMLRLSIVVNMYNTARYLPRCMESLLEQDIQTDEYEIILVDDCSSDNSVELAKDYMERFPNIRLCIHETNKGLAGARNTGLDAAKGKYLCFVDPDDYVDPNSYSSLLDIMDEEQLDIIRFNYQKVDEQYNYLPDSQSEAVFNYSRGVISGIEFLGERLGFACYVWPYIYNLDFIRKSGHRFIEGIYLDDTPWLPRVLQSAKRINCINIRRQYYLQRSSSMVRNSSIEFVSRKRDGQIKLIGILFGQRAETADKKLRRWYDGMISQTAFALINSVIEFDFVHIEDTLSLLRGMGVESLSYYKATNKAKCKFALFNISPKLYCSLIRRSCRISK